jgi:inosose dehydratase
MDGSLLGLCLDTGHSAFGGGDALDVLRDHGELVNHVHLKDVDRPLLDAVHARGDGLEAAWADGVFCRLGSGQARVGECLDALVARGYDGWLVVEQDVVLSERFPFARVAADARANREFLRARGS